MTATPTQDAPGTRLLGPRRLLGVDVARGLALIGMMSVHIFPDLGRDGAVSWAYRISSGRASALFAVLAGLSLVLATRPRGDEPPEPGARRGVMGRAGFIAGVGLFLGMLGSGVAVILVHYAVLFAPTSSPLRVVLPRRMIRAALEETHLSAGSSVRSG